MRSGNSDLATGVSGSGAGPYTFTVANPGDGPVDVVLATGSITDLAGNPFAGDSWSYTIDTTQPSVALTSVDVPNGGYANAPVSFTATFSEAVTGFDDGDISVANGAVDDFTAFPITVDPIANTIAVTGVKQFSEWYARSSLSPVCPCAIPRPKAYPLHFFSFFVRLAR